VKNWSKYRVRTATTSAICCTRGTVPSSMSPGCSSPQASRAKKSMPTALTNGSANGSLTSGSGLRVATARAAATIVAVAPTLDAKSHVSSSARLMLAPSLIVARLGSSSPAFRGALIDSALFG
jgi:hypothetical protein